MGHCSGLERYREEISTAPPCSKPRQKPHHHFEPSLIEERELTRKDLLKLFLIFSDFPLFCNFIKKKILITYGGKKMEIRDGVCPLEKIFVE